MEDSQAVSSVLGGDKAQYEKLVEKYKRMVYAIAWSHLGDADLSEDAAQETFVKAYSYLGTLRNPERFPSWLTRIARNVCSSFKRRMSRENAFKKRLAVVESAAPPPEETRENLEEQLWKSVDGLPQNYREALAVFYIEGKSTSEAAAALGISEAALRTRLHRARITLRQQLERRLEDALGELEPGERFTHSVMALLPLAPKGVALGVGGVAAVFGKLLASLSFLLGIILGQLLLLPVIRLELGNIKEAPENRFRKALVRHKWIAIMLQTTAFLALLFYLQRRLGPEGGFRTYFKIATLFLLPTVYAIARTLRINRSRYAVAAYIGTLVLVVAQAAVGFANAPIVIIPISLFVLYIIVFTGRKSVPGRDDYNIFLRCATGGIGDTSQSGPTLPRRLNELHLSSFARFLGEQWMAVDYSWQGDGILLTVPGVGQSFANPFALISGRSKILITYTGQCTAMLSDADMKAILRLSGSQNPREELQNRACRALMSAFAHFLDGDRAAANSTLTAQSEEQIYQKPISKSLHWRILFGVALCSVLLMLILHIVHPVK